MVTILSKSKYLAGLQCPKLLWRLVHDKENIPSCSAGTQAIFDQGHDVGHLAQSLFPGGVSIPWEAPPKEKLRLTKEALPSGKPVYEATFSAGGAYAQVDILVPQGERWDIVEVKSSTSASDIHLHDLSLQRHACEAAGLPVGRCMIAHLNNQYVRQGPVELYAAIRDARLPLCDRHCVQPPNSTVSSSSSRPRNRTRVPAALLPLRRC